VRSGAEGGGRRCAQGRAPAPARRSRAHGRCRGGGAVAGRGGGAGAGRDGGVAAARAAEERAAASGERERRETRKKGPTVLNLTMFGG
jgi:hypothetical protein